MISTAFGKEMTLADLRRRFSVSARGMNLRAMLRIADALDIIARPVRLEIDDLGDLKMPAVLHWELNHFVVVERRKRDRVLIHDPARGRRWVERPELSRSFTGVAVEFTPAPSFVARSAATGMRFYDLFERIRGLKTSMVQMFALAAVMQIFALLSPMLTQFIVDEAITKGDIDLLTVLVMGMLILLLITTAVKALQSLVGTYMTTQMSFQLRTNLLRHTLRLPISWFEKRHIGDVLSRFSSLQPIQDTILNTVPNAILNLIIFCLAIAMMAIYSPLLLAVQVVGAAALLITRTATFPYFRRLTQESLHRDAKVQTTFLETIRGARAFKLFGHEHERVVYWQNDQARLVNIQVKLLRFGIAGSSGVAILSGLQQIATWYFGARLVIGGTLTVGMLFAFQAYASQFSNAATTLITQFFSYRTARLHLDRLADVAQSEEERGLDIPVDLDRSISGRIGFSHVSFRYADHEPWVLKDADLAIEPGEFVCIRGPSGGGKTTLLKLILGFEDPQRGEISIDGTELRRFGIRTLRHRVGVVLQDDQLFGGTIADNISFFDPDAADTDIEEACQAARIHDEIAALPMGYRTLAGDLGSTLSGGQRQRLLLARALYRKPAILILDEGTANLDAENERSVMATVADMAITRIVVAHRQGAMNGANRFLDVREGSIRDVTDASESGAGSSEPVDAA